MGASPVRAGRVRIVLAALLTACTAPNPAYWPGTDVGAGEDERLDAPSSPAADAARPLSDAAVADGVIASDVPADAPAPDAASDADGGADARVTAAGCGTGVANISGISGADGLVIDTDGTLYFLTDDATSSYVGRIRPGQAPQIKWLRVDNAPVTWGLGLDSARRRLYVLVVSGQGALVAFDDITGTPTGKAVITGLKDPNDVVVAPDGTVYYSSQGDRQIYRLAPGGSTAVAVTTTPLGDAAAMQAPAALALDDAQNLVVGLAHGGPLYLLTLAGGVEQARTPYRMWTGWANGLTFDRRGRLYVSIYDDVEPRSVVRLEADGRASTVTSGGRFSSLVFGRGALDCRDLYVTDPYGPMRRVRVDDAL
jgi:streptogramin lyase